MYTLHPQRIHIEDIRNNEWFKKDYTPAGFLEYEDINLDDVNAFLDDSEVGFTSNFCVFFHFIFLFCYLLSLLTSSS